VSRRARSYTERATDYAERCVDGRLVVGQWERMAAERHLRDLDNASAMGFVFDEEAGDVICRFLELLPHIRGPLAARRERIHLHDSQCFDLCSLYAWLEVGTHLRRFRTGYIEMGKKQGKSLLLAGLGLFGLAADGEEGAEVYVAGRTEDQSKIIWEMARRMCVRDPEVAKSFGIAWTKEAIYHEETGSTFKPLTGEWEQHDGKGASLVLADELHAHPTGDLYRVLESGQAAREQPMFLAITTAGTRADDAGIWMTQRRYVQEVLQGAAEDDRYWGVIRRIDDKDDPFDERCWRKAMPLLDVAVPIEFVRKEATKARRQPSHLPSFLAKHLCRESNSDSDWLDRQRWNALAKVTRPKGSALCMSVDLSSRLDFSSACALWVSTESPRYVAEWRHYLPEDRLEAHPAAPLLRQWADKGFLTVIPGSVIDLDWLEEDLWEWIQEVHPSEFVYDFWHAEALAQGLARRGCTTYETRTTPKTMNPPMRELEAVVAQRGAMAIVENPVTDWMAGNVVSREDHAGNIFPRKASKNSPKAIDGMVALLFNLGRALAHHAAPPPPPPPAAAEVW
jgi:phage terminase large subunit-like protein